MASSASQRSHLGAFLNMAQLMITPIPTSATGQALEVRNVGDLFNDGPFLYKMYDVVELLVFPSS